MNITESIIRNFEKDGIVLTDRKNVYCSIDTAIEEGRFEFISNGKNNIGFFTFQFLSPKEVIVENLFIERKYRGTHNLRWGIRYLKAQYKELRSVSWRNRKKNKPVRVNLCFSQ